MKPRLLVITTTFPAKLGDGTPAFVLDLARSMSDFDVTVLAPRVPGAARDEVMSGVSVHRVAYFPRRWECLATEAILPAIRARPTLALQAPALLLAMWWASVLIVHRLKPVAIHAHWIVPGGLIAAVHSLRGLPFVLTVHGADAYALQGRMMRSIKHWVLGRAKAVVPVSHDIARVLELPAGAPVLPMGVDVTEMQAAVGLRAPDPVRLLFVGRLVDKKGVDVLLQALCHVADLRLDVIGDGPERQDLELLCDALGLGDRVSFLGVRGRSEVVTELQTAVALVVPSRVGAGGDQEGVPVVLAEAMAAGVPVIASDLGGISEHLMDGVTGILVPPSDVQALAQALQAVADGVIDLEGIADRAVARARASLDTRSIAAAYEDVIVQATT